MKVGLYLSPWDRHESSYGDERAYNEFYLGQLRELLSGYGPVMEVWFDGAKGPEAADMEYDFPAYWALVRQLQPAAVIFSDEGPDVRWIGNERGFAGPSNWSMIDRSRVAVATAETEYLNTGDPDGLNWVPGECDVSIRDGWFWHEEQAPKSLDELLEIYFKSVGRNCVLLLNVPPDDTGRLDAADIARLFEMRAALDAIFSDNLALEMSASASNVRGGAEEYSPQRAVDDDSETYWATDDSVGGAHLEVDLGAPTTFNVVSLQEPIQLGQRVANYRIEVGTARGWESVAVGTTIGYKKLDRIPRTTARRVRLVIEDARGHPLIAELGLYLDPSR